MWKPEEENMCKKDTYVEINKIFCAILREAEHLEWMGRDGVEAGQLRKKIFFKNFILIFLFQIDNNMYLFNDFTILLNYVVGWRSRSFFLKGL